MNMRQVDSEEEITKDKLKKIRARRQFKALVRHVIANIYWLTAESHIKRKNLLIVQKRSGRCMLTISEKAILKTPPKYRTEEQVNLLYKTIGFLKCFRKYSEDIKHALVAHTTYEYFPANRVIVRQNAPSLAMYFIIAGQVEIKITKYVVELGEESVVTQMFFEEGDVFGEVSLLHDTRRLATITTMTHCEFLVLHKEYFDTILKALTMERWQEILQSVASLPYFDKDDQYLMRDLCVMSHLVKYNRNEIILGDGVGMQNFVHFIIKGTCKIIEHVPIQIAPQGGIRKEVLFTVEEEEEYMRKHNSSRRKSSVGSFLRKSILEKKSVVDSSSMSRLKLRMSINFRESAEEESEGSVKSINVKAFHRYVRYGNTEHKNVIAGLYPEGIKIHFIEVCTLNQKCVFNVGEEFQRRRVVATSPVTILRVPAYWLLPQSNVWDFIKMHINRIIPNSAAVFRMYEADKKYQKFKKSYIQSLVKSKKAVCNTVHNVPYSIRIREDFNFSR